MPRVYYVRAAGVGLLGWSKGAGNDKGRVYGVVTGAAGIPRCRFAPAPPSLCERGDGRPSGLPPARE